MSPSSLDYRYFHLRDVVRMMPSYYILLIMFVYFVFLIYNSKCLLMLMSFDDVDSMTIYIDERRMTWFLTQCELFEFFGMMVFVLE